jgi:hypothetical protein
VHAVYDQISRYWTSEALNPNSGSFLSLTSVLHVVIKLLEIQNTSVISIAGGVRDTLIRSELCTLDHFVLERNQLVAISTQIPHVWSEVDHNAGVWCNQLMVRSFKSSSLAQPYFCLAD